MHRLTDASNRAVAEKLTWVPNTFDGFCFTSQNAGGVVGYGFAGGAGVLYFFSVFLCDGCNGFVFKVDEFGLQFKGCLGTFLCAFTTAAAFVRVYYDEVFA